MENKNQNKLWFKAKRYGYGWHPVTWQGWGVLFLYFVSVYLHFINIDKFSHSASDTLLNFMIPFLINTFFLLIICWAKGEKAEWRWGDK